MGTNCAGRHECEPEFYPMSLDERWVCPECRREHVPFAVADTPGVPQRIKDSLLPGHLGWRTQALTPDRYEYAFEMGEDTHREPHLYLGMFESRGAAIFFGGGMALFAIGTVIRVIGAFLA